MEIRMEADRVEMQNILKDYLAMFHKINSIEFIQKTYEQKRSSLTKEVKEK